MLLLPVRIAACNSEPIQDFGSIASFRGEKVIYLMLLLPLRIASYGTAHLQELGRSASLDSHVSVEARFTWLSTLA